MLIGKIKIESAKIKEYLFLIFLTITSFGLSFYKSTSVQGSEDFLHGVEALHFLNNPAFNNLIYEFKNSIDFITLPFYLIMGANITTLRFAQSCFLSLSILFFFLFCKNFFKDSLKAGLASALLLSIPFYTLTKYHPEFIFLGFFATLLAFLISQIFNSDRKKIYSALSGLVLAIASYRKIIFLPYGLLFIFFFLLINKEDLKKILTKKNIKWFLTSFLIGIYPYYTSLRTRAFFGFGRYKDSIDIFNTANTFFTNILIRIDHLKNIFFGDGSVVNSKFSLNLSFFNHLLFLAGTIYLLYKKNRTIFFVGVIFLYVLASTIPIGTPIITHLYILLPLFVLIITEGAFQISGALSQKNKSDIAVVILGVLISINLFSTFHILKRVPDIGSYNTEYQIGHSFKGSELNQAYILTFSNQTTFPFWHTHLLLTSGNNLQTDTYTIERSANKELKGSLFLTRKEKQTDNLTKVLEESKTGSPVYIHTQIIDDEIAKNKLIGNLEWREFKIDQIDNFLSKNNYKKITIPHAKKSKQEVVESNHLIWVHKNQEEVIKKLEKLD